MNDLKTSGIKLSEIRPCDFCGGKIAPQFYVLDIKFAMFGRGTSEVLGLVHGFGFPLGLAESFAPRAEEAIVVAEDPAMNHRLFICQKCYLEGSSRSLAEVAEITRSKVEKKEEVNEPS